MLESYGPVAIFVMIAVVFPFIAILLGKLLAPRKLALHKHEIYECGVEVFGSANIQFKTQFYLYALIFVVFDVGAIFIIPWAVAYLDLGLFALINMVIFMVILYVVGLSYAWRKQALEWR
jgi:NADH-quinone oxidoreductase subunit A